jgi:hypothetical protein
VRAGLGLAILLAVEFAASAFVLITPRAGAEVPATTVEPEQNTRSAVDGATDELARPPSRFDPQLVAAETHASRSAVLSRLTKVARPHGSDAWSMALIGITLALAVCGGMIAVGRRFSTQSAKGDVQVVSRVSLSPKHAVYVLRVGRRALLVGAGPQGPPSLISELDDLREVEANAPIGEEP